MEQTYWEVPAIQREKVHVYYEQVVYSDQRGAILTSSYTHSGRKHQMLNLLVAPVALEGQVVPENGKLHVRL